MSPEEAPQTVQSFKQRVQSFWQWYASEAQNILDLISDGRAPTLLTDLLVPQMERLGPGFGWVFGPGESGGHSLTLTPEGALSHQFLADYWRDCAPQLAGWTFYSSRQRSQELESCGLCVGGYDLAADELRIAVDPDPEYERIDIQVWHPLLTDLPEQPQYQIVFLLLDEALGEHGTASLIGDIAIATTEPRDGVALTELRQVALDVFQRNNWTPAIPAQSYTLLTLDPPGGDFLRSDIYTINSTYPQLVIEYLNQGGMVDDPVAENGAAFVFLDIPMSHFPSGEETQVRGEIEDTISDRLVAEQSGMFIGGSTGSLAMYSDFVLFDGDESVKIVHRAMLDLDLPSGSSLHHFGGSLQAFAL
jgi:hypothetical protein